MEFLLKDFDPNPKSKTTSNEAQAQDEDDEKSVASAWPTTPPLPTSPVENKIRDLLEKHAIQSSTPSFVADVILEFLETFARGYGLQPERIYFSFATALPKILDQQQSKKIALGDIARKIHAYGVLATQVMKNQDVQYNDNFSRVKTLCALLDAKLPIKRQFKEDVLRVQDGQGEKILNTTKLSARCAIPYAFGYDMILPRNKVHFLAKSIVNGQEKQMAVALQYLTESATDLDGKYRLSEYVSRQQLKDIICSIPAPLDLLQGLKYHQESGSQDVYMTNIIRPMTYEAAQGKEKSIKQRIEDCEAILPPSSGSILRVYIRQHLEDAYDEKEPHLQHMMQCVPK